MREKIRDRIVYKVLVPSNKKLYSLNKVVGPNVMCQRYFTNRINYPKFPNSYILAFNTLGAAIDYSETWDDEIVIYKAETQRIHEPNSEFQLLGTYEVKEREVRNFWQSTSWLGRTRPLPDGTVLCHTLLLLEKVMSLRS